MLDRSNQEIIDDIIMRCSEKLDKQLYLFENILTERETLGLLEDSLYFYIAGQVLLLNPTGEDVTNNPELIVSTNEQYYKDERAVLLRYILTLIHFEINKEHDVALKECIKMLETTTRTFNREFLNVVYLMVLFDHDELYKNLCRPLANYAANIIYNEFQRRGEGK